MKEKKKTKKQLREEYELAATKALFVAAMLESMEAENKPKLPSALWIYLSYSSGKLEDLTEKLMAYVNDGTEFERIQSGNLTIKEELEKI